MRTELRHKVTSIRALTNQGEHAMKIQSTRICRMTLPVPSIRLLLSRGHQVRELSPIDLEKLCGGLTQEVKGVGGSGGGSSGGKGVSIGGGGGGVDYLGSDH